LEVRVGSSKKIEGGLVVPPRGSPPLRPSPLAPSRSAGRLYLRSRFRGSGVRTGRALPFGLGLGELTAPPPYSCRMIVVVGTGSGEVAFANLQTNQVC